ncbi:MAG TPA: PadR family transcriptional regulator [Aggregatilineaceae bacterium]|nr:PadR family transcriptional regulator [Aggregatilineaceae bacterium]
MINLFVHGEDSLTEPFSHGTPQDMERPLDRGLTIKEYSVLGLLGIGPQSSYSLVSMFSVRPRRLHARHHLIRQILKRLERAEIILSELDISSESNPQKIYSLTPTGEMLLDNWLKKPVTMVDILDIPDVLLNKFLFMEHRLSRQDILTWLDSYEQNLDMIHSIRSYFSDTGIESGWAHEKLTFQYTLMEFEMRRTWLQQARQAIEDRSDARVTSGPTESQREHA